MWLNHAIDTRKKKSAISAISEEIKNINVAQPPFEVPEGGGGGGRESLGLFEPRGKVVVF